MLIITSFKINRLFIFLLILINSSTFAQLVNVEKSRKKDKEGLQGYFGFAFNLQKNTKQVMVIENSIQLQYQKKQHTILGLNDLQLMSVDDERVIHKGFQHIRYSYLVENTPLTLECFVQNQYNSVRKLKHRYIGGGGVRFRIIDKEKLSLQFAPLLMYEHEEWTDDSTTTQKVKADCIFVANYQPNAILSMNTVMYYQPSVENINDFRFSSESGLVMKITGKLSISILYETIYDSKPPLGIPKFFYGLKNMLTYSF